MGQETPGFGNGDSHGTTRLGSGQSSDDYTRSPGSRYRRVEPRKTPKRTKGKRRDHHERNERNEKKTKGKRREEVVAINRLSTMTRQGLVASFAFFRFFRVFRGALLLFSHFTRNSVESHGKSKNTWKIGGATTYPALGTIPLNPKAILSRLIKMPILHPSIIEFVICIDPGKVKPCPPRSRADTPESLVLMSIPSGAYSPAHPLRAWAPRRRSSRIGFPSNSQTVKSGS